VIRYGDVDDDDCVCVCVCVTTISDSRSVEEGSQTCSQFCKLLDSNQELSRHNDWYGPDDQVSRVRFPVGARNFSLHHRVQNGSGAYPASYPMGTRGSFPEGKAAGA
jgi:hypothetical protein